MEIPQQPNQPFRREEIDRYFDGVTGPPCNKSDCPECTWRNSVRALLGTLVEAAALANTAAEAGMAIWGQCDDPACSFERDITVATAAVPSRIGTAMSQTLAAVRFWKTLPHDWSLREIEAMNRELTRAADILAAGAVRERKNTGA